MYPPSMQGPATDRSETVDTSRRFSELYFGFASNLAPSTMRGRCPDSVFCGLARLDNWRWTINSTSYANIVPSPGDVVYGGLYFLSPRDEAGLDHSEGMPWLYEKQWHDCVRISPDGSESDQKVPCLMYVDVQRPDEGTIEPDYIIWINKAIREAKPYGLPGQFSASNPPRNVVTRQNKMVRHMLITWDILVPDDYIEKYLRPYIPPTPKEEEEREIQMIRVMSARK